LDVVDNLGKEKEHPVDYYRSFKEIVEYAGYNYDSDVVVTKDGYHLKMFRIRSNDVVHRKDAPVVFLQHGLFSSADCWIGHTAELAPAFQFAKNGYDVWLGNNRGNKHSRHHDTLSPDHDQKEFYNYDF
jgi:pimeloyl-ACP methyl ester carboxylesterase